MIIRNILGNDTFKEIFYEHSQFSFFAVIMFFKVALNAELVNTELLLPSTGNTELESSEPPVTPFLSTSQYVALFHVFLF